MSSSRSYERERTSDSTGPSSTSGYHVQSQSYLPKKPSAGSLTTPGESNLRSLRSRRQDPSCDACRKRKVRCNATITTPCKECIARGLECRSTQGSWKKGPSLGSRFAAKQQQHLKASEELAHAHASLREQSHTLLKIDDVLDTICQVPHNGTARPDIATINAPSFAMAATLLDIRFLIHRSSLHSLHDGIAERAFQKCLMSARLTLNNLPSLIYNPNLSADDPQSSSTHSSPSQGNRLAGFGLSTLCQQVWRCTIILLFVLEFESAAKCIAIGAAMGASQSINTTCGYSLVAIIERLSDLARLGPLSTKIILQDEDLIRLATLEFEGQTPFPSPQEGTPRCSIEQQHQSPQNHPEASPTSNTNKTANPWPRAQLLLQGLMEVQGMQIANTQGTSRLIADSKLPVSASSGKERMSIPNLI